jgi:hypothetical protein
MNSKFLVRAAFLCNNASMMVPVLRDTKEKKNTPFINICTDKVQEIRPIPIIPSMKDILNMAQV